MGAMHGGLGKVASNWQSSKDIYITARNREREPQIIVQKGPSYKSVTTYLEHAKKIPLATQPRKTLIGKKTVSLLSIETGVSTFHTNPYHLPSLTFSQNNLLAHGTEKGKISRFVYDAPPSPPLLADSCLALLLLCRLGYRLR